MEEMGEGERNERRRRRERQCREGREMRCEFPGRDEMVIISLYKEERKRGKRKREKRREEGNELMEFSTISEQRGPKFSTISPERNWAAMG